TLRTSSRLGSCSYVCSTFLLDAISVPGCSVMRRVLLLCLGWLAATLVLYLGLLLLDVYWNLVSWHPRWDSVVLLVLFSLATATAGFALLARASYDRLTRSVSLILCGALLALGIYSCPAEALGTGLFGRDAASPVWYRGVRLL